MTPTAILNTLGWISMAFTVWFTWWVCTGPESSTRQTRRESIIESWVNIIIGFSINFVANLFLLPLVEARLTPGSNFMLGWIYTAISMMRSYAIRRFFNDKIHQIVVFSVETLERLRVRFARK